MTPVRFSVWLTVVILTASLSGARAQESGGSVPGRTDPTASFPVDWGADLSMLDATSRIDVAHEVTPAGHDDAWYFDVVLSGTVPEVAAGEALEDQRLVTSFLFGVVSLALPEPDAWVAYDDVTLSAFDARSGSWVVLRDMYEHAAQNELRDGLVRLGAKVGFDVMSLFVPAVAWANLLLLVPRVVDEFVGEELDASQLTPSARAFRDPNVHRVVQRPWRLHPGAIDAWDMLAQANGTLPLRVRIPVHGLARDDVASVRSFVAFTSEHSRFAPVQRGNAITGTTAAPEPSQVFSHPEGMGSVSALQVRTLEHDSFSLKTDRDVGASDSGSSEWVRRAIEERESPPEPGDAFGVEATFEGEPGRAWLTRLSYATRVHAAAEANGGRMRIHATIEGGAFERSDGGTYQPGSRAWSLDYLEGVAYVAMPNVEGLLVDYDGIVLEAYDFEAGRWDLIEDNYVRPDAFEPGEATEELGLAVVEKVIAAGFDEAAGRVFGYSVDVLALIETVLEEGEEVGVVRAPEGRAFRDPNAYRLVARPWRITSRTAGFTSSDLGYAYRDPRHADTASMRLRVTVPVSGLPVNALGDVRVYVAANEAQRTWRATGSVDVQTNEPVLQVVATKPRLLTTPPLVPLATERSDGDEDAEKADEAPSATSATERASLTLVVTPSLGSPFSLAKDDLVVTLEGPERRTVVETDVGTAFPVTLVVDELTPGTYRVRAEHGSSSLERTIDVKGGTLDFEMVMP